MNKKILFIIFLIYFVNVFSQNKNLLGTWVLDKVIYSNGKDMEVNSNLFSYNLTYRISPDKIKINDYLFDATFSNKLILLGSRKLNYEFREGYLLINDIGDDKIYLFLKQEDFVKHYPEFEPKTEVKNGDTLIIANEVIQPIFKSDISFDDFLIKNMYQGSSKDYEDLYFKAEYILTKNNKIKNIVIVDGHSPRYDKDFIVALKKAEKYFQNPFGKDMLVTKETHFLKWMQDLKQDDKMFFKIIEDGENYYKNNKFEKAITEFEKIGKLKIGENRFKTIIDDANLQLGISYLETNQIPKACETFLKIGDKTNFKVRNYLINFCNKE